MEDEETGGDFTPACIDCGGLAAAMAAGGAAAGE